LDDPSVSPLHARLKEKGGEYFLSDEKSVAGTWVNYEQLTGPRSLNHGDVIHFGRLSYRFMLRKPPELPRLTVTSTKK
jgi:pSer/pThr/pTyr-binding forkhead associated (FHA) protein